MPELAELLKDLTSGEAERSETAAVALKQFGRPAIRHLGLLAKDADPDVRWWAIRALSEIDDTEASEFLIAGLEDTEPAVRQCAALALATHPTSRAIEPLIRHLSGDPMTARLAGNALVAIGSAAVPALIKCVENNGDTMRAEATRALALIGDTQAIPTLFKLLDAKSVILEHWATQGLEKMGVGMSFFQVQ